MFTKKRSLILAAFLLLAIVLVACQPQTVEVTRVIEQEVTRVVTETVVEEGESVEVTRVVTEEVVVEATPEEEMGAELVTLNSTDTSDIPDLDPQIAEDVTSINYIENLFVHLTNYDRVTNEVVPEAATSWEVSDDGTVWTFNLRTDIPWVKYNPVTGETTQEVRLDAEGNEIGPAFVTAGDFVNGIHRACDPNLGSYYSSVVGPVIKGCSEVLNYEDPENIPQELIDAIGVTAVDDATLQIELAFPAGYFLSMTPMWTITAAPQWTIDEWGDDWVEAGRIVTNGLFVLEEWIHDVRRSIVRNPLMPEDMAGEGNIERWVTDVVPDTITQYNLWLNNEADFAPIPPDELQNHLSEFPDGTNQIADLAVFYMAFNEAKPPFDNPLVREAFSAAFDRETFVTDVLQGQGVVQTSFAPPSMFGAPPRGEVGINYDPELAQAKLAEAGYPDCEGLPPVSIIAYSSALSTNWLEFAVTTFSDVLGCSNDVFSIEQLPFRELLAATAADIPLDESPNMWTLGWGPDYPDENNWVGDVIWCGNPENRYRRPCTEVDDMIVQAREEIDPDTRVELYRQIEEMFFGQDGEVPFIPIYERVQFRAEHPWYEQIYSVLGGQQMYNNSIDMEAKQAAGG